MRISRPSNSWINSGESSFCWNNGSCAKRFPRLNAATNSNALAGPIPLIALSSLTEQRLNSAKDLYFSRSSRATSITFIPRRPVRRRIAINSGLVSASGPRASNFSRGRSSCGISRIFSCAIEFGASGVSAATSDAKLIEHFAQHVAETEQCLGVRTRFNSIQCVLRLANQVAPSGDRFIERSIGRAILQELNHFFDSLFEDKLATTFPLKLRC